MTLNVKAPDNIILKPVITVFGVGGAGGNAVNNMIKSHLQGANFVVANTDAQVLEHSECPDRIQLGALSTKGLGAGASPEVGRAAAEESEQEIRSYLENSNMVFITAGMGGGTGTGASPVIARIAKELGILTVGVVTKPFLFEGAKRMKVAEMGLAELQNFVDTLIVIPNQNLFRIANEHTTFTDAFKMADEVLHAGVRGVTDLITMPGLINLDFADIKTVMSEMGKAMMGTGEASGEERAIKAAEAAIANPLLDHSSMCGASGVLINITGGRDMTLYEVDSAANRIREEVGDTDANIIFGSTFNPDLEGIIRVSVVATGIDAGPGANKMTAAIGISKDSKTNDMTVNANSNYLGSGVFGNVSIDELKPPSFNDYAANQEYETQDIKDKLKKLADMPQEYGAREFDSQRDKAEKEKILEEVTGSRPAKKSHKENKPSIFQRMWHSLKSQESYDKDKYDNIHMEPKIYSQDNAESTGSEVHEIPSFLRKKK